MSRLPTRAHSNSEQSRILRPSGYAVVEVANSVHAARRIAGFVSGKRAFGEQPIDIRSEESRQRGTAPYVNHHPRAMLAVERLAQQPLGRVYFGPSMFFLLQKTGR
jgi:hypothetical protein